MADETTIVLTLDGVEHRVVLDELTAQDAKEFRAAVGVSLAQAVTNDAIDLDVAAGLIWLARRKLNPKLAYQSVARSLTYGSDISVELLEDAEEDETGPEASGGISERSFPPSPGSTDSAPGSSNGSRSAKSVSTDASSPTTSKKRRKSPTR